MLLWEIKEPALIFAQSYLTRLLHDGDYAKAVKVMARCRHVNESFLPLADDRELAREAAEAVQAMNEPRSDSVIARESSDPPAGSGLLQASSCVRACARCCNSARLPESVRRKS